MIETTVDAAAVRAAASLLEGAQRDRVPCVPVRDLLPDSGAESGYSVQRVLTEHRLACGRRITGRKIGLTSPVVQRQLGVDQPDFGMLFDDMACSPDEPVETERLLQPRIEAEVAFVLAEDLDGPVDMSAARQAVGSMVAALEIVDSRIAKWDITIVDTIADNASSGLYVLGPEQLPLGETDLREVQMTMVDQDGHVVSSGTGDACLGDPIEALVWLARTVRELGEPLRAGEVVLSGALGPMLPITPGSTYTASLSGIGTVRAAFTA